MAETTLREEIDNVWASLETDEETPNTPEMAVVADEPETAATATPETPEAVAPPTEETPPAELTVDDRGRYHRPDGTIASKEEVEAFKAKGEQAPSVNTPAIAPESPTAPPKAETAATPFRYRAIGQTMTLEGATEDKDGNVVIPAAQVAVLRQKLAGGEQFYSDSYGGYQKAQEMERTIADLKQQRSLAETKSSQALDMFDKWSKMDRVEALTQINDWLDGLPSLMAKAEAEYWKQQAQRGVAQQPAQAQTPETAQSQGAQGFPDREAVLSAHTEYVEQMKLLPEYRSLTEDDWRQLAPRLERMAPAFIRPASAEEMRQGYPAFVYDTDLLLEEGADYLKRKTAERENAKRIAEANKAAAFNKSQTTGTTQQPVARAKAPAPAPTTKEPAPVDRAREHAKWKRNFLNSGFEDLEDE